MIIDGLTFKLTCSGCPEQYDVFRGEELVGYIRARYSVFRVDQPFGTCVLQTVMKGFGTIRTEERAELLTMAAEAITESLFARDLKVIDDQCNAPDEEIRELIYGRT